jgi:hypothetical protein
MLNNPKVETWYQVLQEKCHIYTHDKKPDPTMTLILF